MKCKVKQNKKESEYLHTNTIVVFFVNVKFLLLKEIFVTAHIGSIYRCGTFKLEAYQLRNQKIS